MEDTEHTAEMGDSTFDFQCLQGEHQFCDCDNPDADVRVKAECNTF